MINFEDADPKVKKQADKIISECIDLQFTYRDFEHLIRELQEHQKEVQNKFRSIKMI